jgi:hypothetical protein
MHKRTIFPSFTSFTLVFSLVFPCAWAADKPFPGIQQLMSPEEFSASGLDKLNDQELKALDDWLLLYTAGEAAILREDNREVREAAKEAEIVSRIQGDFRGWTGETVFRLENGQVWRQRLQGKYRYSGPPNPEVKIYRNFLGFYMLKLVDADKSVGVKLVR